MLDGGIAEAPLICGELNLKARILNSSLSYCLLLCDLGQVTSPI